MLLHVQQDEELLNDLELKKIQSVTFSNFQILQQQMNVCILIGYTRLRINLCILLQKGDVTDENENGKKYY